MSTATIVTCPNCGAKNRIDESRARVMQPVCGRCKTRLDVGESPSGGHPLEVTDDTFERDVLQVRGKPVLLDCWAPWCGPCRMMAPEYSKAAEALAGQVRLVKLNTEAHPQAGAAYNIRGIPTMAAFIGGREKQRHSGAMPAASIVEWVKAAL